jgi:hypothetical protein
MSLRDLVTGSDMCTPSGDGAGPSNAMGALVNSLLGGAGKTQEQLREVCRSALLAVIVRNGEAQGLDACTNSSALFLRCPAAAHGSNRIARPTSGFCYT